MDERDRPPPLRDAMRRLQNRQLHGHIEQPDHEIWMAYASMYKSAHAEDIISHVAECESQYDTHTRYLVVPDDLSVIAESGLMLTHFQPFMARLRGTHSTEHADTTAAHGADGHHRDLVDGDSSDSD